jgi:hypothetical protein
MLSTCLMVMGVPRSGTSCAAGVLHKLGVDMGAGHFQPKDWANPRGYFEDMRWRLATQRITGRGYSLKAASLESIGQGQRKIYRQLARQCAQKRLWGMKDPWLCFVARFIWPILEQQGVEVRLVATFRPREASIASVRGHLYKTYRGKGNAEHIIDTWQAGLDRQLTNWSGAYHYILYEDLVADPMPSVRKLADFAYQGIDRVNGSVEAAARWVTPQLNHHKGER